MTGNPYAKLKNTVMRWAVRHLQVILTWTGCISR